MGPLQNHNYVLLEVEIHPGGHPHETKDIIYFYNKVFVLRMKDYLIASKYMPMEQGARTPVLNKSNFEALLTPGGKTKPQKLINELLPMTPLVD